jgi:phosphopantetheinyl transferase
MRTSRTSVVIDDAAGEGGKRIVTAGRSLEPGGVSVLILEHEGALEDEYLLGLLEWSQEELARMARFRHQGAKTSWCLSRRLLGDALCELAGIEDAHLRLEYGEYGKPFIRDCDIRFNWSHTEGCVALGLAAGRELGVDIENARRPQGDYLDIAESYFSEPEREWIGRERGRASWARFLSLFVQKEAWLKAKGQGLNFPLAEAKADLALPPARSPGRALFEIGKENRYFVAVDASIGGLGEALSFVVERRELGLPPSAQLDI